MRDGPSKAAFLAGAAAVSPWSQEPEPKLLLQAELAKRWRLSARTLEKWRTSGRGPKYLRLGGRVVYRMDDVEEFETTSVRGAR